MSFDPRARQTNIRPSQRAVCPLLDNLACVLTINSGRTEPMWQVVVDLTFLWCEQHKKLISHKTVTALKKKTAGVEQFDKFPTKVFTKEAGWLRKEPEFWV